MIDLLQIAENVTQVVKHVAADRNGDGHISFGELVLAGGWLMVPIGIMLGLAVYFFAERVLAIKAASKIDDNFMNIIRDNIVSGNISAARSFAKNTNNPVARVVDKGIQRIGKPIDSIEKSMENVATLEMYKLEKNLGVLSIVAKAAPIFGFVGTLVGMMQLFSGIKDSGFDLGDLAGGIYTKLITSITGLLIGLAAYFAYNYLNTKIEKVANRMEAASSDFLDILQEPTR
ncbi:MAG TPA: MotA/TolQ/ExbB proton channel family protein [Chitinophagaceae bacterium]|nr:MotA/TolQ/ExbB proton channel family protein [Chitinophagaceae bacterium]